MAFWHVLRFARSHRPKALLLENVRGLLTCDGVLSAIQQELALLGYTIAFRELDSASILPQRRNRLYFIAIRDDLIHGPFSIPPLPHLPRAVSEILEGGEVGGADGIDSSEEGGRGSREEEGRRRDSATSTPQTTTSLTSDSASTSSTTPTTPTTANDSEKAESDRMGQYTLTDKQWAVIQSSQYYRYHRNLKVVDISGPANTARSSYRKAWRLYSQFVPQLQANPRFYTPREIARLQGFPENYKLEDLYNNRFLYQLVGNAVSVPVVAVVASSMLCYLQHTDGHPRGECGIGVALDLLQRAVPARSLAALRTRVGELSPCIQACGESG